MPNYDAIRLRGNTSVTFPFVFAQLVGASYIIKNVNGLGPPEYNAYIETGRYGVTHYGGRTPANRQIVMRIGLNPNYTTGITASDLRTQLYRMIHPNRHGLIAVDILNQDVMTRTTLGTITRFEIVPFAQDPEVQITIDCVSPYFEHPTLITQMGPIAGSSPISIDNIGDVPAGFEMVWTATSNISIIQPWRLQQTVPVSETVLFVASTTVASNTQFKFSTVPNFVNFQKIAPGVVTSFMGYISATEWPLLLPGVNTFTSTGTTTFRYDQISYRPLYEGV